MQPERSRDRLKSAGISRAKMYLKLHLQWLDGAPVAQSHGRIEWRLRPRIGSLSNPTISVDRNVLCRSQAALTTLIAHFPRAMHQIVGDVSVWHRNTTSILERLKSAIHDGADLMDFNAMPIDSLSRIQRQLVDQMCHQDQLFVPMLRFVIWSGSSCPAARDFLIPWIAKNAEWIGAHLRGTVVENAWMVVLRIGDLAQSDGDEFLKFVRFGLGEGADFQVSSSGLRGEIDRFVQALRGWRDPCQSPPQRPIDRTDAYGSRIIDFVDWLSTQDRTVRLRVIHLGAHIFSQQLVRDWHEAWGRLHTTAHRAIRSLCQTARVANKVDFHSEACRVSYEVEKDLAAEPLHYPLNDLLDQIKRLAVERSTKFCLALDELLSTIRVDRAQGDPDNDGMALKLALISDASRNVSESSAIYYFELSRKFLRNNAHQELCLRPWGGLISAWKSRGQTWASPLHVLCEELPGRDKWADFFLALEKLIRHEHYTSEQNDAIAKLVKLSSNVDQACERFVEASPSGLLENCSDDQLAAAAALQIAGFKFIELLELIGPESAFETSRLPALKLLHSKFADAGWEMVIPSLLRAKQLADVSKVAMQFQLVVSSGDNLTIVAKPGSWSIPQWAESLPVELHPAIAAFNESFPDSPLRARRILEKHFPDPDKMRTEIAALREMGSRNPPLESNLQRRLDNLCQRLYQPQLVTPAALNRIRQKLEQALITDVFREAGDQIQTRLVSLLGGRSGVRLFARHILPQRHLELAQGVLKLDEPYRTFGLRLLTKCWGDVPWNHELEPANRRFLDGMVARGMRIEHWLNSRSGQVTVDGQDQPWTLAFEANEVERMLMGYYFGTCLSPDDCNFFSAVVNAIDINKQVLYARNSTGEVVGRCLIALSDVGTVIAFRAYCYTNPPEFQQHVAQFVSALAADLGTVVSHTDHVSVLVAPKWYDDCAVDLGNSITGDNSLLRVAIKNATTETLISLLQAALSPVGLNNSMLELVIELPEFLANPQLIRPLIPLVERHKRQLGVATRVAAARLAHRAGIREFASQMLDNAAYEWIRRELVRCGLRYSDAFEALEMLIEYRPSIALRLLRATREKNVSCDREETNAGRRTLLAACFNALGRTRLAQEMRTSRS